jgi:hypothetical protein
MADQRSRSSDRFLWRYRANFPDGCTPARVHVRPADDGALLAMVITALPGQPVSARDGRWLG